ncbi:MAG TPA: pyridoxal phosphate-dependent aminotransferase [Candidatus Binataceae bacterium]|jgi:aspartate aminotransferase|nr:pyridoxal phosphate-dependent aminotransferase [Candidatus Binataceae bacterium]
MIKLNRRIAAIKPSATMAAEARATEMKAAGIDVISLAAGEPDFDTPEHIKDAARRALAEGFTHYTPVSGTMALKQAICAKLARDSGLAYEPAEILASAGAKQAEANVIAALFDEGDQVIIPTPAWVSFVAMVNLSGAEALLLPCPESDAFQLDPARLREVLTPRTRGILLNSPSNPTGAVYSAEQLAALARVLLEHDLWIMSDDVYEHMSYDGPVAHLFAIEPRLKPRGIIFNSLSKTYAMTGWRIGFAAGPREVITAASRLQSQNSGNPNSLTQVAAIEALTGSQAEVATMVAEFRARRELTVRRIRALPGFRLPHVPQGAFYCFPNISALIGARLDGRTVTDGNALADLILNEAQVALVGGNDFGAPDHVRISYATSIANLNRAFDRIEGLLKRLSA